MYNCVVVESQEEKPVVNGESGFVINLSKDQKDHYGSQFGDKQEAPGILGEKMRYWLFKESALKRSNAVMAGHFVCIHISLL